MYCTKCGAVVEGKFCTSCGTPANQVVMKTENQNSNTNTNVFEQSTFNPPLATEFPKQKHNQTEFFETSEFRYSQLNEQKRFLMNITTERKKVACLIGIVVVIIIVVLFVQMRTKPANVSEKSYGTSIKNTAETTEHNTTTATKIDETSSVLEVYESLQSSSVIPFTICDNAKTFLQNNHGFFPTNYDTAITGVSYTLSYDSLMDGSVYGDALMYTYMYVELVDVTYSGSRMITHINAVDAFENWYYVYFLGGIDVKEDEEVLIIGLPMGFGKYDNRGGGTTKAAVLAGSYLERFNNDYDIDEPYFDEPYDEQTLPRVIYSDNMVIITLKSIDEDILGTHINLMVENISSSDLHISVDNADVNGYTLSSYCYMDVSAGKKANDSLYISNTTKAENDIDEIFSLEFTANISGDFNIYLMYQLGYDADISVTF